MRHVVVRPRRTTRPGSEPSPESALQRELLVNVHDARVWIAVDGQLIELRAVGGSGAQRSVVDALDSGLLLRA